jgi:hypothetical protein
MSFGSGGGGGVRPIKGYIMYSIISGIVYPFMAPEPTVFSAAGAVHCDLPLGT